MRRTAIVLTAAAGLVSCGGSGARPADRSSPPPVRSASAPDPAHCAPAPIHRGPPPAWTAAAWSSSSPGFSVPYALASDAAAGAFFFAPRLRAGHPTSPANKVLWIVRFPRNGHPLDITARLGGDPAHVVRSTWPADASPGEIYPSYVDLPATGCWRLSLAWGKHRATIDVRVHPAE